MYETAQTPNHRALFQNHRVGAWLSKLVPHPSRKSNGVARLHFGNPKQPDGPHQRWKTAGFLLLLYGIWGCGDGGSGDAQIQTPRPSHEAVASETQPTCGSSSLVGNWTIRAYASAGILQVTSDCVVEVSDCNGIGYLTTAPTTSLGFVDMTLVWSACKELGSYRCSYDARWGDHEISWTCQWI